MLIIYSLAVVSIVDIVYHLVVLYVLRPLDISQREEKVVLHPVSVVICNRNDAHGLKKNLPWILNQKYPVFEVIVVDDFSSDESGQVLQELQENFNQLRVIYLSEIDLHHQGKKRAITVGVKSCKYEYVLHTDADCVPTSENWISCIMQKYIGNKQIIVGYGRYQTEKGLLNKLIRFDAFMIGVQYMAFAKLGMPYMGVGRNMSYRKGLFIKNNGLEGHVHLDSGDDDLFIQDVANASNTGVSIHCDSHTISQPEKTFKKWILQKTRHVSTATSYKWTSQLLLISIFALQYLWFILLACSLFLLGNFLHYITIIILLRISAHYLIFGKLLKRLCEKEILPYIFFLEFLLLLFYPIFHIGKYGLNYHRK